jgi:hypothetical protein
MRFPLEAVFAIVAAPLTADAGDALSLGTLDSIGLRI